MDKNVSLFFAILERSAFSYMCLISKCKFLQMQYSTSSNIHILKNLAIIRLFTVLNETFSCFVSNLPFIKCKYDCLKDLSDSCTRHYTSFIFVCFQAARRESDRQRQMEWERQRKEQLLAEKAREYEQLGVAKTKSSNLKCELDSLVS